MQGRPHFTDREMQAQPLVQGRISSGACFLSSVPRLCRVWQVRGVPESGEGALWGGGLQPEPGASGCRMGGPRKVSDLTLVELGVTRGFSVGRAEVTFGDHGSCQVEN